MVGEQFDALPCNTKRILFRLSEALQLPKDVDEVKPIGAYSSLDAAVSAGEFQRRWAAERLQGRAKAEAQNATAAFAASPPGQSTTARPLSANPPSATTANAGINHPNRGVVSFAPSSVARSLTGIT